MKRPTVIVGKQTIPLSKSEFPTLVWMTAGAKGKNERGIYAFWTTVLKVRKDGQTALLGRCRVWMSPGDRFDRMQHEMLMAKTLEQRKVYGTYWKRVLMRGRNIKEIRPSNAAEILEWARGHESDWKFMKRLDIA